MGLHYNTTLNQVLVGSKTSAGVRTGVELESTYSDTEVTEPTKVFKTAGYSKAVFNILYTMGSGESSNSIEVKIDQSPDGVNFYRIANDSTSGGTSTITAREFTFVGTNASTATISIFLDVAYEYTRIAFKETGVGSVKGTAFCEVTLSGQ